MSNQPDLVTSLERIAPNIWQKSIELNRNDFLIQANQVENHVYYVKDGALRAYLLDKEKEYTVRLGYKGNILNALPSFLSGKPSQLYIQALKKTKVLCAPKQAIMKLLENNIEFQILWRKMLEDLFLQQFEREMDLLKSTPEERYARVLQRSPRLFQEIPSKYIADYLRMSPETLSRLKKS